MLMLTMGSLFDGIGGFPLAAVHNGIRPVWASEIETFPIEVTRIRFPGMFHAGDITKLKGAELPPVDIVCGGSPCQDLSVAGKRQGLAGERSGLFMEQVRIVKEMREADGRRGIPDDLIRPRYLVWENVPGAFSSAGGEDFRAVIEEIVRIKDGACHVPGPDTGRWEPAGAAVLGDQFSLAWRVLDAQYWGVPQRRRRIFLVADFGGRTAYQILFEQYGLQGDTAESESAWQGTARPTAESTGDTGRRRMTAGHGREDPQTEEKGEVLCLNDQGGERMDITEGVVGTLRAGMGSHQPLVSQPKDQSGSPFVSSFHVNQRDEVIDLNGLSGALMATRNMQMQTFVAESPVYGVVSKGNGDCFLTPECHTSLTGGGGQAGQGYPCVLCLNDQGGNQMELTEDKTGTLRAQEHGHQPLVFDNHGQDARFTGPVAASQTVSAGFGMGGNNQPLVLASGQGGAEIGAGICPTITGAAGTSGNNQPVLFENRSSDTLFPLEVSVESKETNGVQETIADHQEALCIVGNIIDRQPQNGGNGFGYQRGIAYTLTATDHHAVFTPQGMDGNSISAEKETKAEEPGENGMYQTVVGALCRDDEKGISSQYVSQDKCIVEKKNLIRRLTPLECERLQGFPDGWTDIPGASDSARYKALGNSVAVPCVDFVMRGIAHFLRKQERKRQEQERV